MSYFDTLLSKRPNDKQYKYLWELKVTDLEYAELKQLLVNRAKMSLYKNENCFTVLSRECVLFVAEYWRREYKEGPHSKEMILEAIDSTICIDSLIEEFYRAAKRGARMLHLDLFKGEGGVRYLDSMLYQGGLPMKLVTGNDTNSVWDRFTRGLVCRRVAIEELDLGIVASNSQSLKNYCNQIILGIDAGKYQLMPFSCQNENNAWFIYLTELAKQEKNRQRQSHPFSLTWEFRINTVEKIVNVDYVIKGPRRLTQSFIEEQGLQNVNFFSVQVRNNNQAVDSFDYVNNFCRYEMMSKHPYADGDFISLFIHNQETPYLGDDLDMSIPHILFRNSEGKFELGNQLGKNESFLLVPEGWQIDDKEHFVVEEYAWGTSLLQGMKLADDYTDNIIVRGKDGVITFGKSAPLYWTEMRSHPLYQPDVAEPIYNAIECDYALGFDTEEGCASKRCSVQYRNKWQEEWSDMPSFGEIFARAIDNNGNYVTPIRFINVGEGIGISILNANQDTCQIRITWPYGHVSTTEGDLRANDSWEIKKENCENPHKIHFTFTPNNNSRNQFILSIKAPFKDFSIVDIDGNRIENDCWVPYSDIDRYMYHLVGQDVPNYSYGGVTRELRWRDDKLYIIENGQRLRAIPYEGSLTTLFDSREALRSLLDRMSQNMLNAKIDVQFTLSNNQRIGFSIKELPLRVRQMDDGHIVVLGKNNEIDSRFNGDLKLLCLNDPEKEPEVIHYEEGNGGYTLPETIRSWGKSILIGNTKGRVCPTLVDLTRIMDREYRANNREDTIAAIKEGLNHSHLGDDLWQRILKWFDCAQKECIPASSILELFCVANNPKFLLCLAFQLFAKCRNDDDRIILGEQLKTYSNDLAFQWYWLRPYLSSIMMQLVPFIDDLTMPAVQDIYISWATGHEGEDIMKYLTALNDPDEYNNNIGQCLTDVLGTFAEWMKGLCISSLKECYSASTEYVVEEVAEAIVADNGQVLHVENDNNRYIIYNQEGLSEETDSFFNNYTQLGLTGNEQWLYKRVKAVAAHLNGEINLFEQKDEIRRSIIFCSKSCNYHFVIVLNNELYQN